MNIVHAQTDGAGGSGDADGGSGGGGEAAGAGAEGQASVNNTYSVGVSCDSVNDGGITVTLQPNAAYSGPAVTYAGYNGSISPGGAFAVHASNIFTDLSTSQFLYSFQQLFSGTPVTTYFYYPISNSCPVTQPPCPDGQVRNASGACISSVKPTTSPTSFGAPLCSSDNKLVTLSWSSSGAPKYFPEFYTPAANGCPTGGGWSKTWTSSDGKLIGCLYTAGTTGLSFPVSGITPGQSDAAQVWGGDNTNGQLVLAASPSPSANFTCGSAPTIAITAAGGCLIQLGASSCNGSLSWTSSNTTGGRVNLKQTNSSGSVLGPYDNPASATNASETLATGPGTYTFSLYDPAGSTALDSRQVSAVCASGTWDGTKCAGTSGTLSGTLTFSGTGGSHTASCTIQAGHSTCNVSLDWSTQNPVNTSAVTSNRPAANTAVFTGNNGTSQAVSVSGAYPSTTYYLYNNAVQLDSATATASCPTTAPWDSTSGTCKAPPGTPTGQLTVKDAVTLTDGGCTIPVGSSGCGVATSWTVQNPMDTLTQDVVYTSNPPDLVNQSNVYSYAHLNDWKSGINYFAVSPNSGNPAIGSHTFTLPYQVAPYAFILQTHGSTDPAWPVLDTKTATVSCAPGGTWDSGTGKCAVSTSCPTGYTGTPPNCTLASSCPAGYTGTPPNCTVSSSCPNGLNFAVYPSCACPSGQVQSGSSCVTSAPGALSVTCSASPTDIKVNDTTTWVPGINGGAPPYSYSWSGTDGLSGTGFIAVKTYTTPGLKNAFLSVVDSAGHSSGTIGCSNSVNVTTSTLLPAPTGLQAQCYNDGSATVSWNSVGALVKYQPMVIDTSFNSPPVPGCPVQMPFSSDYGLCMYPSPYSHLVQAADGTYSIDTLNLSPIVPGKNYTFELWSSKPNANGTYTQQGGSQFSFSCSGTLPPPPVTPPVLDVPPIITLTAPVRVRQGGTVTLSWTGGTADSCTLVSSLHPTTITSLLNSPAGGFQDQKDSFAGQTSYTLTCLKGTAPASITRTVNLTPATIEK